MQETLSISNALNGNRKTEHKVAIASARKMNRRMAAKLTAAVLAVIAAGCGTAKVADRHSVGDMTVSKPRRVYVADFELEPADVTSESGLLPLPPKLPGLGDFLPPLPGTAKDPKKLASQLVDEMSAALVKDLNKAGLAAQRRRPAEDPGCLHLGQSRQPTRARRHRIRQGKDRCPGGRRRK
jgi:hypothetical protein